MALRSPPSLILRASRLAAFTALCVAQLALAESARATTSTEILTSRDPADPLAFFEDRLKDALSPTVSASFAASASGPGVLSAVLSDQGKMAFAQRDGLTAFRSSANGATALELYGEIPACVVALVRRNGTVQSYADLLAARRNAESVRIDIGASDGWTATTMSTLSSLDVTLAHPAFENRGGARAVNRVLSGETDMLVVMAYGPVLDRTVRGALENGTLEPAAVFTKNLVQLAELHALPYSAGRVALPRPGMFAGTREYETICTSLGVVVNTQANGALAETVARIAVNGALTNSSVPWLDNALKAAGWAFGEVRRAAAAAAEPGLAWLARWATPASAGPAPVMRPASNLKDHGQ